MNSLEPSEYERPPQRPRRTTDRDRIQRILIWSAAVVLVVGGALALKYARGYRRPPDPPASSVLPSNVAVRVARARFVGYKGNGKRAWIVRADQIDSSRTRSHVEFVGNIEALLLDPQTGAVRAVVTAPGAIYTDQPRKTLQAKGAVTCRIPPKAAGGGPSVSGSQKGVSEQRAPVPSPQDLRIVASELTWDVGGKELACPGRVTADMPESSVEGRDMIVDLTTRGFRLKDVHARFAIDEQGDAPPLPFQKIPL